MRTRVPHVGTDSREPPEAGDHGLLRRRAGGPAHLAPLGVEHQRGRRAQHAHPAHQVEVLLGVDLDVPDTPAPSRPRRPAPVGSPGTVRRRPRRTAATWRAPRGPRPTGCPRAAAPGCRPDSPARRRRVPRPLVGPSYGVGAAEPAVGDVPARSRSRGRRRPPPAARRLRGSCRTQRRTTGGIPTVIGLAAGRTSARSCATWSSSSSTLRDPGEVEPVGEQVPDPVEALDVGGAVQARALRRAVGIDQPAPLVDPQVLHLHRRPCRPRRRSRRRRASSVHRTSPPRDLTLPVLRAI